MIVLTLLCTFNSDYNECAADKDNNCDDNAFCTNTIGSFNCTCKEGWTGDGNKCDSK